MPFNGCVVWLCVLCAVVYPVHSEVTTHIYGAWICKAFPDGTFFHVDIMNCLGSCSKPVPSEQVCASHCNASAQFVLLDHAACSECLYWDILSTSPYSDCNFACPPENPYIRKYLSYSPECSHSCRLTDSFNTPVYEYEGECSRDCPDERFFVTRKNCVEKCPKEAPLSVQVTGVRNYCTADQSCPTGFMKNSQTVCIDKCPDDHYIVNNTVCVEKCPLNMKYTLGGNCVARCPPLAMELMEVTDHICDLHLGPVLVITGLLSALQVALWLICCMQCACRCVTPSRQKYMLEALASLEADVLVDSDIEQERLNNRCQHAGQRTDSDGPVMEVAPRRTNSDGPVLEVAP